MVAKIRLLADDESGVTAIEYALIILLISISCVAAAILIGQTLSNTFNSVAGNFGPTR